MTRAPYRWWLFRLFPSPLARICDDCWKAASRRSRPTRFRRREPTAEGSILSDASTDIDDIPGTSESPAPPPRRLTSGSVESWDSGSSGTNADTEDDGDDRRRTRRHTVARRRISNSGEPRRARRTDYNLVFDPSIPATRPTSSPESSAPPRKRARIGGT